MQIQDLKNFHQDTASLHLASILSVLALCAFPCDNFSPCRQTLPSSWQQPQDYFYKLATLTQKSDPPNPRVHSYDNAHVSE